jgi:hypothetical protein
LTEDGLNGFAEGEHAAVLESGEVRNCTIAEGKRYVFIGYGIKGEKKTSLFFDHRGF